MKKELLRVLLVAILAALSAAIGLFFTYLVPSNGTFGFPFYAIPIILASLVLGPIEGLLTGFLSDLAIGFLGPYGYLPLYVLSSLAWGFFPGLIRKKESWPDIILITYLTYLLATLFNTVANLYYFGSKAAFSTLLLRIVNLIIMAPVLAIIVKLIYSRVKDLLIFKPLSGLKKTKS